MYQIGDKVVYGVHGVCQIVEQEERLVDRKRVTYLVLEPVGQVGSRYLVPSQNQAAMSKLKPMLTREELEAIFTSDDVQNDGWIRDEGARKQTYRELITSGDRVRLMAMVRSLYRHKAAQTAAGKKCHLSDDNFLRDGEKLLSGEIAVVLNISPEEARDYLRKHLKEE